MNPSDEAAGTAMIRIFIQTGSLESAKAMFRCLHEYAISMQHYSGNVTTFHYIYHFIDMRLEGFHWTDPRTRFPKPFLVFYPALIKQSEIHEVVHVLPNNTFPDGKTEEVEPVPRFEDLKPRLNYETANPTSLTKFGPTDLAPLGSAVLARSGDKVSPSGFLSRCNLQAPCDND